MDIRAIVADGIEKRRKALELIREGEYLEQKGEVAKAHNCYDGALKLYPAIVIEYSDLNLPPLPQATRL